MPAISNVIWLIVTTSELMFSSGSLVRPLIIVRRSTARGMRLSVDPRDAVVRLSLPVRAPIKPALAWVATKRSWIEAELARVPMPQPIIPGMTFMLAGDPVTLDWQASRTRTVKLERSRLMFAGPEDGLSARVIRYLKREALGLLKNETDALGVGTGKVGIGDPRSRWGSCAANGDIRYSWRLILAPAHVRRATVAHEVAHRVHMNHGAAFHALVAELHGADPAPARAWLKAHGTALHWFGRGG